MIRRFFVAVCVLGLGLSCASGQMAPPAADTPGVQALPPGHPDLSAMMGPATQPTCPVPHGNMPATGAPGGQLPSGHPDIGALMNKPAATSAKLIVRVKQGTKGGPAVAGDPVTIAWYQPDQPVQEFQARLDEHGVAFLDNLPLTSAGQPLVTVTHAGVAHEAPGEIMNAGRPDQVIEATVYETAATAPAWKIAMWHVVIMPAPVGLSVTQVLMVQNPTDRNWLGAADAAGKRTTLSLPIPAGAQNVEFNNGIHDLPATVEAGKLTTGVPLIAGTTQYQISYLLPLDHDQAKIEWTAPAPVGQLVVMMPEDGSVSTAEGLGKPETSQSPQGAMRIYKAQDLAAQAHASLAIVKKTKPAKAEGPASSSDLPKIIAAVGGGSLLAVGAGVALFKSPRNQKKTVNPV